MIDVKPLSEKRFNHCLGVAKCCYDLAQRWGGDPTQAYLAGLFHDIAREMPSEQLLSIAREHRCDIDEASRNAPILLHGAVSGIIAKENYNITDPAIIDAMEKHTLGDGSTGLLDRILFLSDAIEPNRRYEGIEDLRNLARENLTMAVLRATEQSLSYLKERSIPPHRRTLAMLQQLKTEIEQPSQIQNIKEI